MIQSIPYRQHKSSSTYILSAIVSNTKGRKSSTEPWVNMFSHSLISSLEACPSTNILREKFLPRSPRSDQCSGAWGCLFTFLSAPYSIKIAAVLARQILRSNSDLCGCTCALALSAFSFFTTILCCTKVAHAFPMQAHLQRSLGPKKETTVGIV